MQNETSSNIISTENPAFCTYLICSSLLILKMMGVTLLTILHRMRTKVRLIKIYVLLTEILRKIIQAFHK